MDLIKSEVTGEETDVSAFLELSDEEQQKLAALAKHHSLAQLLGDALGKHPESKALPVMKPLLRETMTALGQTNKMEQARKTLCRTLEDGGIPYIQLKDSRIRPYYPEPWMRTSCDIDLLVPEEEVEKTAKLLVEKLHYTSESRNYHDISMYSPAGIHLELHFSIKENTEQMDRVLIRVWENSRPAAPA